MYLIFFCKKIVVKYIARTVHTFYRGPHPNCTGLLSKILGEPVQLVMFRMNFTISDTDNKVLLILTTAIR